MQKYQDAVLSLINGATKPVAGATVLIKNYPSGTTATIYSDNGTSTKANPTTTDPNGNFSFYAADGRFSLEVSGSTISTATVTDILLEDVTDGFSELAITASLNTSDLVPIEQSGTTKKSLLSTIADWVIKTYAGFVQLGTGAQARTPQAKGQELPSVQDFGASTSASAATNTTAFNAAIAAHSVIFVPGDTTDIYDLNALATVTASKIIYGNGAKLRFNTTGDAITLAAASAAQANRVRIVGLAFGNITNTPTSYIKNTNFLNTVYENLQFSNCAATWCIDNVNAYGAQVRSSVFSDVTGGGVRFRDDGAVAAYSYASKIRDSDFTRVSGDAVSTQGNNVLSVDDSIIQACGRGIATATAGAGSIQGWNVVCKNTHFESNVGNDLDLGTDGNTYWSTAVLIGSKFNGAAPKIALGAKSKITLIGCNNAGASACTVSGSSLAEAYLLQSTNFVQSGSFIWSDYGVSVVPGTAFTPTITFGGAAVGVTYDATNTSGRYSRVGNRVWYDISLVLTSKGSSVGVAKIGGLPFTSLNATNHLCMSSNILTTNVTSATQVTSYVAANDTKVNLVRLVSGGVQATLDDTTFANNSQVYVSGCYDVS